MSVVRNLITREWLKFFAASAVVLLLLLSLGNLISGFLRENVTAKEVLLSYFIQLPSFLIKVIPISCLIGSLFSINKLKSRNELVAIFAGGYSRQSYLRDILLTSIYVAIFQFILSAYISPYINSRRFSILDSPDEKFRVFKKKGLSSSTIKSGKIWYKSPKYYFAFSSFDKKTNTLNEVTIYHYNAGRDLTKIDTFKMLSYDSRTERWWPTNGTGYDELDSPSFPKIDIVELPITLNESIEEFTKIEADISTLTFLRLYDYITQLNNNGINVNEYLVMFYMHISEGLICIIFALIAATSIFNPNRRNSSFGRSVAFIFIFTILYWLVQSYFIELGKNLKISPFLATFSVPFLFTIVIVLIFFKNRRLT
ncbi:LptF/LptG family permease [Halobacteriovorax sp. GFR7]|uniref:LptF/LptG family permease n=1 Tax=unclassified Halobacteriovorax TaxID=2639665 RepID=UPI003D98ECA8